VIFLHYRNADWAGIRRVATPALAQAEASNLVYDRQPIDFAVALAAFEEGDFAAAVTQLEDVLARATALGHQQYGQSAQSALLLCELYRGRLTRVVELGERGLEQLPPHKGAVDRFVVLTALAAARLRLGDDHAAAATIRQAFTLLEAGVEIEARPLGVRALSELVEVGLAFWSYPELLPRSRTLAALRKLERCARRRPHLQPLALLQRGRLEELRGGSARAARAFKRAIALAAARGMRPCEAVARQALAGLSSGSGPLSPRAASRALDHLQRP